MIIIMIIKIIIIIIIIKIIIIKIRMLMIYHLTNLRKIWNILNLGSNKDIKDNHRIWLRTNLNSNSIPT
jgi:hypothetical protein